MSSFFRIINIFANGLTDEKDSVSDNIVHAKRLMTCAEHREVTKDYIDTKVHLKHDYSVLMEESIDGKIHSVTFFI